ncbi:MAG TPA: BlaI/MecI/CopY family transcriptional regulator, partial [Thermoanaerobaculia bacterium]|nr:BlaI/MecI/CopY family transcriptional regulator [Thermoanaerobaculia bacterium]
GAIRHREKGLRYVYLPTTPRSSARRSAMRKLLDIFFGGSAGEAATALLKDETWSDDELDELAREIERVRKERRSS